VAAEIWLTFAFAWFVLSLAPGPDNLFVLMQSLI
jgi:threonine/homoserine/homoserine lactone efflux protein